MKPARMSLQLADRTAVVPHGVGEDVLVKVGMFVCPIVLLSWIMMRILKLPLFWEDERSTASVQFFTR